MPSPEECNDDPLASLHGSEDDASFERAVGRFIIAWADAEYQLYRTLVHYSGVSYEVGRAIFSGSRAKGMIDFTRSILHNKPAEKARLEDIDRAFSQLVIINTMRDHLVHHVSDTYSFKEDKSIRVVTNVRSSRIGKAIGYEIGAKTIRQMTWDLYGIANMLGMHWMQTGQFQPWRENYQDVAPTPWLYKPPKPIPNWEGTPKVPE